MWVLKLQAHFGSSRPFLPLACPLSVECWASRRQLSASSDPGVGLLSGGGALPAGGLWVLSWLGEARDSGVGLLSGGGALMLGCYAGAEELLGLRDWRFAEWVSFLHPTLSNDPLVVLSRPCVPSFPPRDVLSQEGCAVSRHACHPPALTACLPPFLVLQTGLSPSSAPPTHVPPGTAALPRTVTAGRAKREGKGRHARGDAGWGPLCPFLE